MQRTKSKQKVTLKDGKEAVGQKIRKLRLFQRMHPNVLREILGHGLMEHVDKGVVSYCRCEGFAFSQKATNLRTSIQVFRQGDQALNWYAVIAGSLDVRVSHSTQPRDISTLCTLGAGTAFGETVLTTKPHSMTVVSNEPCILLRVRKSEFQEIWDRHSHLMGDIVAPFSGLRYLYRYPSLNRSLSLAGPGSASSPHLACSNQISNSSNALIATSNTRNSQNIKNPSSELIQIGMILRTLIVSNDNTMIRDRKMESGRGFHKCLVGSEMVDWLISVSAVTPTRVHSRSQAVSMWQVLMEEGVLLSLGDEKQFFDRYSFYKFCFEEDSLLEIPNLPTSEECRKAESALVHCLALLNQLAPEANFRLILRKPATERTSEEIDVVYEELVHIQALSHLGDSIRKELAQVIAFEKHPRKGTVLFNQGDAGKSWYIILRGSVNVVIVGKGVVCTLNEGDDFGKLALVNDAPRAATIITNEDNCHFLKLDKEDYNRILRDAEANTVRLKEHNRDVLVLRNTACKNLPFSPNCHYKFNVLAGTPAKTLDHVLETRVDILREIPLDNPLSPSSLQTALSPSNPLDKLSSEDTLLQDFLLTYIIYMPSQVMCLHLLNIYKIDLLNNRAEPEFVMCCKRRVIRFTREWTGLAQETFYANSYTAEYLELLNEYAQEDSKKFGERFDDDLHLVESMVKIFKRWRDENSSRTIQKWKNDLLGPIRRISSNGIADTLAAITSNSDELIAMNTKTNAIHPKDEVLSRIYCADHTYTTLKVTFDATALTIKTTAADKLGMSAEEEELILVEVKSSGERIPYLDEDLSILTGLSVNGRAFVSLIDHIDALTALPEQEGPKHASFGEIEDISSQDIAYYLTFHSWIIFQNVHEFEFIYRAFGRANFGQITANLDLFLRFFEEIQFWVVTEICLTQNLSKRVARLRKFIKIAGICKEHQNMAIFMAITMGLSNIAVSRLTQTWDRLPNKAKRTFAQYEALIEPSRNYRRYHEYLSKLEPPFIPCASLIVKDITVAHEGTKTLIERDLVNFEKMTVIAQALRLFRYGRSKPLKLGLNSDGAKNSSSGRSLSWAVGNMVKIDQYMKEVKVIDNQRVLLNLSHSLEHRKL